MQDWHISFGSCAATETLFACVVILTFIVVFESEKLSDQRTIFRYKSRMVVFFSCSLHDQLGSHLFSHAVDELHRKVLFYGSAYAQCHIA